MKSRWTRTGIFLLILSIGNLTPALFFGQAAPGKKHSLRERPNQKYWTVHLDEFFDHFLKGVPYLERGKGKI